MKKKTIGIVVVLLAVAAAAVWAFWPKGAEPQHGELFLQEFQRFIEPLCKGEEAQYEILDNSGQDITEQVKQAVQKCGKGKLGSSGPDGLFYGGFHDVSPCPCAGRQPGSVFDLFCKQSGAQRGRRGRL